MTYMSMANKKSPEKTKKNKKHVGGTRPIY